MAITIDTPQGVDAWTEFVTFHDTVYAQRAARWTSFLPLELPILTGESPFVRGRRVRPFWARENRRTVARVLAVIDERYQKHWNEKLGMANGIDVLTSTTGHRSDLPRTPNAASIQLLRPGPSCPGLPSLIVRRAPWPPSKST